MTDLAWQLLLTVLLIVGFFVALFGLFALSIWAAAAVEFRYRMRRYPDGR